MPRLAEEPFEASTRRMTTLHSTSDGRWLLVCKGAPEVVLAPDVADCESPVRERLGHEAHRLADAGLRVLAITAVELESPVLAVPPTGLRPLGLVGIGDPIREGAAEVAAELEDAGIRLVMITGDHPATAVAIADRMGIWRDGDTVARATRTSRLRPPARGCSPVHIRSRSSTSSPRSRRRATWWR